MESFEIWLKINFSKRQTIFVELSDFWFFSYVKIIFEYLSVLFASFNVTYCDLEEIRENVSQLRSKAISTACHFFVFVIVVWTC